VTAHRLAPSLLGAALALACGDRAAGPPPNAPQAPERPASAIRFVPAALPPALDVVQVGGSPGVDYIIDSLGCGAAWLDYDGDGDEDLYLAQGATPESPQAGPPDRLLRNDGDVDGDGVPAFTDVTAEAGLGDVSWSFGVSVADYDGDGDPDLYLSNYGPNRLYRNDGDGRFTDVAAAAGVADDGWSSSSAWSDVDRDGDLDLFVVNYVVFSFGRYPARGEKLRGGAPPCVWKGLEVFCGPRNLEAAWNRLYLNEGDPDGDGVPRFREAAREAGLAVEPSFGLAARFFDADDDGDDDLYVANDSLRNAFFVNHGDGTFDEAAIFSGVAYNEEGNEQAGMGIAAGDYDLDGRLDLATTNFSHDHDTLYHNDGDDLFSDVSYRAGLGTPSFLTLGWGVAFVDLDQDGLEDLFVAHGHVYPQVDGAELGTAFREPNAVFRNRGDGTFEDVTAAAGPGLAPVKSSRVLLPHDVDGDGDLDLLITNFNDTPDLLLNDSAGGHWLQVRLAGAGANRDGIGARVRVVVGGRTLMREMRRDASYAGAVPPVVHFGLGRETAVERVEVRWPRGGVTRVDAPGVDRVLRVEESGSAR